MAAKETIHLSCWTQLGCISPVTFRFAALPRIFVPLLPISPCKRFSYCAERSRSRYNSEGSD
jgi:hypothetical protein